MSLSKVIAHVDIDSFECQVYHRLFPELFNIYDGAPCVVVDETGRIVSATHNARQFGISRKIRLKQARMIATQHEIDLRVYTKPNAWEKPDDRARRYAWWDIIDCFIKYVEKYSLGGILECSASDECYLDITEEVNSRMNDLELSEVVESRTFLETDTYKLNGTGLKNAIKRNYQYPENEILEHEKRLIIGGMIMQEVNNFLFRETKFIASVGVGSNKLMAKLATGLNKPNGITILPRSALIRVGNNIKIEKIPGLGSKLGMHISEIFHISSMGELAHVDLQQLENVFGEDTAIEIDLKRNGISYEPVMKKYKNDKVSVSKSFNGKITSDCILHHHVHLLVEELLSRMDEEHQRHTRQPTKIRFTLKYLSGENGQEEKVNETTYYEPSECCPRYCFLALVKVLLREKINTSETKITSLGFTASDFIPIKIA